MIKINLLTFEWLLLLSSSFLFSNLRFFFSSFVQFFFFFHKNKNWINMNSQKWKNNEKKGIEQKKNIHNNESDNISLNWKSIENANEE